MAAATGFDARAEREAMHGVREVRRMPSRGFELREVPNGAGGTNVICEGYASVTAPDIDSKLNSYEMEDFIGPYDETVVRGAFAKTIQQGCDTAFLVNHGAGGGVTMARTKPGTLQLAEDTTGLHYLAQLNPDRPDVQILKLAVADGAIDESSFAFRVLRQDWSYEDENGVKDWRRILEVTLHQGDVSPVNFGANPHTADQGPVAIRARLLDRNSGRARGAPPVTLPDYGREAHARLDAAKLRSYQRSMVPRSLADTIRSDSERDRARVARARRGSLR